MSATVNVHEAKTHLSKLLERVEAGESIVIARAGRPIAELRAYRRVDLVFGGLAGQFGDVDAAFSDEAEREVQAMFETGSSLDVPR